MFTTLKFKILHRLLGWFLKFYDPHHDLEARTHIDFTRGQVNRFIRDAWRRKQRKQTWHCRDGLHDRNCPHAVVEREVKIIDEIVSNAISQMKDEKKKTILNIPTRP